MKGKRLKAFVSPLLLRLFSYLLLFLPSYSFSPPSSLVPFLPPPPAASSLPPPQVMAVGKRLTSCLLNTFSQPDLASAASQDTLVETERDVMTLLQDERMLRLEDVAQLNRSFNYLMLKVIENGDKNALFG